MTKLNINGKIRFVIHGVIGESAARIWDGADEFNSNLKDKIEDGGAEIFRYFDTEPEAKAYEQGLWDAIGHGDYYVTKISDHQRVFGVIGENHTND